MHRTLSILFYVCIFILGAFFFSVLTQQPATQSADTNVGKLEKAGVVKTFLERTQKDHKRERVLFVGDIMLARNVENLMRTYGYDYPFSQLKFSTTTSYVVGNFEASIPKIHVPTKTMQFAFSVHPDYVQGLEKAGFTHMSLANNHSYDYGKDDYVHTKEILEKNKITAFGDQVNQASSTIAYIELDDTSLGLVGVYAVDSAPSASELKKLLDTASEKSDLQVAYIHFGTEYVATHSAYQELVAHRLIDAGADVVIGHHPHVVQDIQLYKGVPIFYSLGNYVFDQYFSEAVQEGLMVGLTPTQNELLFELIPVTTLGSRSAPREMGPFEKEQFLEKLAKTSELMLATHIKKGSFSIER